MTEHTAFYDGSEEYGIMRIKCKKCGAVRFEDWDPCSWVVYVSNDDDIPYIVTNDCDETRVILATRKWLETDL